LGYMNEEAYNKTKETGYVTFFSRSRQKLWTKGETSGNFLKVVDIKIDCDNDTLLIMVIPIGPVCHTGNSTCFDKFNDDNALFLEYLEQIIESRIKENDLVNSYTAKLYNKGIEKIGQKVGEEAIEVVIETMRDNKTLFLNEAADLMYHYLLLLKAKKVSLRDVIKVLKDRHNK